MFGMEYDFNLGVQELIILTAIGFLTLGGLVAVLLLVLRGKNRDDSRGE